MSQPMPITNSCGCPYTAYTIGEYGAGGGPWCPSCGRRLRDRIPAPGVTPGFLDQWAQLHAAVRQLGVELRRPFDRVLDMAAGWFDRHPFLTGVVVITWSILISWSILATNGMQWGRT